MKTIEYELKTLRYKQQLLAILIFSLVCVGIWVLASLAQSQQTTKIDPQLQKLARTLNPTINQEILQELEQKRRFTEAELSAFPIYKVVDPDQTQRTTSVPATGSTLGQELQAALLASSAANATTQVIEPELIAPETSTSAQLN